MIPAGARRTALAAALFLLPLLCGVSSAQLSTLSMTDASGLAGTQVTSTVILDNGTGPLRGWSYGVCSDAAAVSLFSVAPGATMATIKSGAPPDYQSLDMFTGGFTHSVVICFSGCSDLPTGTGYQLVDATYDLISPVTTTTQLCFCETLGTPPVETLLVATPSTGVVPTQVCGNVAITVPPAPVTGLTCTQVADPCTCLLQLDWINTELYDSINILVNGALVATLPGTATTYTVTGAGAALSAYCVVPVTGGVLGTETCCTSACTVGGTVLPDPVTTLSCIVTTSTCTADLTWVNGSTYSDLTITIDGVTAATLPGTATSASVALPGTGTFTVCVGGLTICGDAIPDVCCTAECQKDLQRGDCNYDGSMNIIDIIYSLNVTFGLPTAPPPTCEDACDSNDDGLWDISDATFSLAYLFDLGPLPPAPFGICGQDTTVDSLGCADFPICP